MEYKRKIELAQSKTSTKMRVNAKSHDEKNKFVGAIFVFRGESFRPEYRRVAAVRSIFQCPCLALSATATPTVYEDVKKTLHLQQCVVHAYPPDRSNIYVELASRNSLIPERDLAWVTSGLRAQREQFPKTIIYCRSINSVTEVYAWLLGCLREDVFVDGQRTVAMFHAHLSDELQQATMLHFKQLDSVIRVVVSTVAFGIGVEIPDIRQVVHWGRLSSLMTYWQEVGRAGRDGAAARAVWYCTVNSAADDKVLKAMFGDTACHRLTLLNGFVVPEMNVSRLQELAARQTCSQQCQECVCAFCV